MRKRLREVVKFGTDGAYLNFHGENDIGVNLKLDKAGLENLEAKIVTLLGPPKFIREVARIHTRLAHYNGEIKTDLIKKFG